MIRRLTFVLTETEERRAAQITLAGVIENKLARGDYLEEGAKSVPTVPEALAAFKAAVRSALSVVTVGALLSAVERVAFEAEDDGA